MQDDEITPEQARRTADQAFVHPEELVQDAHSIMVVKYDTPDNDCTRKLSDPAALDRLTPTPAVAAEAKEFFARLKEKLTGKRYYAVIYNLGEDEKGSIGPNSWGHCILVDRESGVIIGYTPF